MRQKRQSILWTALLLGAAVALAATGPAAAAGELATMNAYGGSVSWAPRAAHGGMTLTVAGQGIRLEQRFRGNESPSFDLTDGEGNALPDGTYKWELVATPTARSVAAGRYQTERVSADGSASIESRRSEPRMQSGSFTVLNGQVVDPGVEEPEQQRVAAGNLQVAGDLVAAGTKNFAVPDPEDGDRTIYYAALEGPEAGTYFRGRAKTSGGEAVIELPASFGKVTEAEGLTVQLTPLGAWSRLYVAEMSAERLVVRDAEGSDGVEFSYLVQGVRKGYAGYQAERPSAGAER